MINKSITEQKYQPYMNVYEEKQLENYKKKRGKSERTKSHSTWFKQPKKESSSKSKWFKASDNESTTVNISSGGKLNKADFDAIKIVKSDPSTKINAHNELAQYLVDKNDKRRNWVDLTLNQTLHKPK